MSLIGLWRFNYLTKKASGIGFEYSIVIIQQFVIVSFNIVHQTLGSKTEREKHQLSQNKSSCRGKKISWQCQDYFRVAWGWDKLKKGWLGSALPNSWFGESLFGKSLIWQIHNLTNSQFDEFPFGFVNKLVKSTWHQLDIVSTDVGAMVTTPAFK